MSKARINTEERDRIVQAVTKRFISPKVRMARVEAAYKLLGYPTLASFAEDHGMYPASVAKAVASTNCTAISLFKLAVALDCSINYLTEHDYFTHGKRGRKK
jgi:hypothetical protein